MHILEITDPKRVDRDGKTLVWLEWIDHAVDASLMVVEHRKKGRKVKLKYSKQW